VDVYKLDPYPAFSPRRSLIPSAANRPMSFLANQASGDETSLFQISEERMVCMYFLDTSAGVELEHTD
jgi:hypothetical protein